MKKHIGIAMAVLIAALGPAWGQTPKPKNDALDVCVPSYIARYAALCETAEIAARGVAYACSPKPTKGLSTGDRYQANIDMIDEAAHEWAYAKALVGILDARAIKQPACSRQ
jgi:hypothetical protein